MTNTSKLTTKDGRDSETLKLLEARLAQVEFSLETVTGHTQFNALWDERVAIKKAIDWLKTERIDSKDPAAAGRRAAKASGE